MLKYSKPLVYSLGNRKNVNGRLVLDIKRLSLLGIVIFGLVGSVGSVFSENLAFAQEDTDGVDETITEVTTDDLSLINSLVDAWNSAIAAIENAIDNLQAQITEEAEIRSSADAELQTQINSLTGASSFELSSAGAGSIGTISYINTESASIASDSSETITATCDPGDNAISGMKEVTSGNEDTMTIYDEYLDGMYSYSVEAENLDLVDTFEIDVSVNCLQMAGDEFSKADDTIGDKFSSAEDTTGDTTASDTTDDTDGFSSTG